MGTAERRERQCQQLREKILNAARELFAAFGYEAVTMRKVAEKIEYSPTTIYLYFHDKDALVRELCAVDFLGLASRFRALQAERDPIRRLKKIGAAYLQFARERPNHYRMMFMTPHPPLAVEERGIEKGNFEEDAWAFLKSTVAEAQRAGMLHDDAGASETTAQLFFAGFHGIAALHIAKSNDPWIDWRPVDELADRMIESLLRGCGYADSPTPRRTVRRSRHSSAGKRSPKGNQRTTRTKR
jgi:AcrR family transcriptional regulator